MTERPDLEVDEPDEEDDEGDERETPKSVDYGTIFFSICALALIVFTAEIVRADSHKLELTLAKKVAEEECNRKWINALLDMPHEGYSPIIFHWTTPGEVRQKVEKIIWR